MLWFCNSVQVSIFFGKEKAVGAVATASKVGEKLDFIESNNSAAAGRFISPDYNSVEKVLVEVKDAVEANVENVKNFQESLFVLKSDGKPGRKLKAGMGPHCKFNENALQQLKVLVSQIDVITEKLGKAKRLLHDAFKVNLSQKNSKKYAAKRQYNNTWKAKRRKTVVQRRKAELLFVSLGGTLVHNYFEPDAGVPQITELSKDELVEVMIEGDKLQALEVLLSNGCFRDEALETVLDYLNDMTQKCNIPEYYHSEYLKQVLNPYTTGIKSPCI